MWCDGHACVCSGSGYSASILPGNDVHIWESWWSSAPAATCWCPLCCCSHRRSCFCAQSCWEFRHLVKRCEQHRDGRHGFTPWSKLGSGPTITLTIFGGLLQFGGLQFPTIFADIRYICRYIIFMFFIFTSYIHTDTLHCIIFYIHQILDHHGLPEAQHWRSYWKLAPLELHPDASFFPTLPFQKIWGKHRKILCKIFPGHWQPKTSIITVQCQNGYIGKVATIEDTPIFHFQDYGRKYVHMPLQEFPQSSFSICRRPGTWCLKYHCVIREKSSFTKQRHFGGSRGIGLHQPPCLWWRARHPQRPRKKTTRGPPLGGRWTHDFRLRINPKKRWIRLSY